MKKTPEHKMYPLFRELKRLVPTFSSAATPIALTDNSLVVQDGGVITKAFLGDSYWADRIVAEHIACEAASLKFFNGRIGRFHCPELCAEPTFFHEKSDRFVGLIRMTEVDGKPASNFLNRDNALDDDIYAQLGELIATLHDVDSASCKVISPYKNGNYIIIPAGTQDETLVQNIHIANYWFSRNKKPAYAHMDVHYGNLFLDSSGHNLTGCIDLAYAGLNDNPYLDFIYLQQPHLKIVVKSYEAAGRNVDHLDLRIEFAKLSVFSLYVDYLANSPDKQYAFEQQQIQLAHDLSLFVNRLG